MRDPAIVTRARAPYVVAACATVLLADVGLPILGCSGDHDRLAKTDSTTTTAAGGGGAGGAMGGAGGTTSSSGTGGIIEPALPTKLTVVNGIVDHDATRHCFLPYPDATGSAALPWPGVEGLPYSRGASIDPIAAVVPEEGDVELVVLGGALGSTGGETCVDLVASPPQGVEVRSLGVLPAATFDEQKSLLLVTTGCLGGPGHTDEGLQESVCGFGYSEQTPTASLLGGFMSRLSEGGTQLPLQFVHASLGLADAVMRLRPGIEGAVAPYLVTQWTYGAIAPFPPSLEYATADLVDLSLVELHVYLSGEPEPISVVPWPAAFANSVLTLDDVTDGSGLVFVAVGPDPTVAEGSWWNGFSYAVLPADP